MEMARQAEQADDDQIDRHHVVQQPRHDQNQNAGNQSDKRI
jgi:hypothetical protein